MTSTTATDPGPPSHGSQPRDLRLVGLLAFVSGGADVVALMILGGAFTSVVTGNLIFVGRAVGTQSLSPALRATMAIIGYIAGVAAGSMLIHAMERQGSPPAAWPRRATAALAAECVVLVAINAAWFGYGAAPPPAVGDVLLTVLAASLGMQGAAARAIAGTPSTTYMTGALTSLVEALATGKRHTANASAAIGLLGLVAGAVCSAALVTHAREAALLPPLAALVLVVALKARHHRTEARTIPLPQSER